MSAPSSSLQAQDHRPKQRGRCDHRRHCHPGGAGASVAWPICAPAASASGYEITAKINKADGLGVGTDVRISGIKIGNITGFTLDPNNFLVTVHMNIRNEVKIPTDASFAGNANGHPGQPVCRHPARRRQHQYRARWRHRQCGRFDRPLGHHQPLHGAFIPVVRLHRSPAPQRRHSKARRHPREGPFCPPVLS